MAEGGSITQLYANKHAASESAAARRQQALMALGSELLNEKRRREEMDFTMKQADAANAQRQGYFDLQKQQADRRVIESDRDYQLNRDYFNRPQVMPAQIAADSRANSDLFRIAQQEAEEGTFDPNAYKSLTPEQVAALSRRNSTVQNINKDVAGARSRIGQLRNYTALSTEAKKEAPKESIGFFDRTVDSAFNAMPWLNVTAWPYTAAREAGLMDKGAAPGQPTQESIARDIQDWSQEQQAIQARLDAYQKGEPWQTSGTATGGYFAPANTVTNAPAVKPLTQDVAIQFLQQARGDKNVARQLAREAGYSF